MLKLVPIGIGTLAVALGVVAAREAAPPTPPAAGDTLAAWVLTPGDSARLQGPAQPIFFRHDIHAGANKIPCQYCHYSVGESSEPGIPSLQSCMGCHLIIGGTDTTHQVEIKKLRDAWNEKQPVEWIRVHTVARHAHFPHMRHIKALGANACQTCHGDVARMPQVYEVNNVNNMGFCVTCHTQRQVNKDCTACHY